MTTLPAPATTPRRTPLHWLNNQPYLLLSLTSLFWAANIVLARHVGSHVPPVTLTTIRWFGVFLILLPFALLLFAYFIGSAARLTDNPNDKLLPSASQMVTAIDRLAFTEDKRSGNYLFWQDSAASLTRLGLGIGIAAVAGLCLGIAAGILPLLGAPLSPLLTVLSMVPPLAPPRMDLTTSVVSSRSPCPVAAACSCRNARRGTTPAPSKPSSTANA